MISLEILATFQAGIFLWYAMYISDRYGTLKSISTSSYTLPHNEDWKFSVVLFLTGILQFPIVIVHDLPSLLLYSSAGMMYTGFTTRHRIGAQKSIHYVGVLSAIAVQFLVLGISLNIWLPAILAAITAIVTWVFIKRNLIWWLEVQVMLFVWMGYMMI